MESGGLILVLLAIMAPVIARKNDPSAAVSVVVDTAQPVSETDANYICATLDWWPPEKCDYSRCPWGSSSVINLNLSHPSLGNAIRAFKGLRIRIGGSLQDQVVYGAGNPPPRCWEFKKQKGGLFGFSKGCLRMERWDELNSFFKKTGVLLTFGLNALHGRRRSRNGEWRGDWDSSNARDLIKYTISKGHNIDSWEFGNELCGTGVGARVGAEQYGKDMIHLNALIEELYNGSQAKPPLLSPGGFYDKSWFAKMLQVSGPGVVDVVTHHLYNLGPGSDHNIKSKILNPDYLDNVLSTFKDVASTVEANSPWASPWVGESGGAYNSGADGVSNTLLYSFWYLDQLGMAALHKSRVYCRQAMIGGFYGLLNMTTFVPSPDYYSALLWHRLMGIGVLRVNTNASPYLRVYAHCTKQRAGVTILLINLSNKSKYHINITTSHSNERPTSMDGNPISNNRKKPLSNILKRSVSWMGIKASDEGLYQEEYHLSGDLRSQTMLLNGRPLGLTQNGNIPSLDPILKDVDSLVSVDPLSIKFVVHPYLVAPGCESPPTAHQR